MENGSEEQQLDFDTIFSLISESERRCALYYLLGRDRPVPLEELVERVTIWNETLNTEPLRERQAIRQRLKDEHLAELQDHGIIEYDAQTQMAEANEGFPVLRSVVEYSEQYELTE